MSCQNHGITGFPPPIKHTLLVLTNSFLHVKSETFGSKIAPSATTVTAFSSSVGNRGAHKTVAGLAFGAQNGQDCGLTWSTNLHGEFIAYVVVNICAC